MLVGSPNFLCQSSQKVDTGSVNVAMLLIILSFFYVTALLEKYTIFKMPSVAFILCVAEVSKTLTLNLCKENNYTPNQKPLAQKRARNLFSKSNQ